MKNRLLLSGALVLAASAAHAAFLVTLDNPNPSIALPNAPTDLIFTGKITKDVVGTGTAGSALKFAGLPGDIDFLGGVTNFSPYVAWTQDPTTNPYIGELFRITVLPTSILGLHDSNSSGTGGFSTIRFNYQMVTGGTVTTEATYSVNITPAPEPATLAILSLGALALRRRRK